MNRTVLTRRWLALAILAGAFAGVGAFTFGYAEGFSCLFDDPAA